MGTVSFLDRGPGWKPLTPRPAVPVRTPGSECKRVVAIFVPLPSAHLQKSRPACDQQIEHRSLASWYASLARRSRLGVVKRTSPDSLHVSTLWSLPEHTAKDGTPSSGFELKFKSQSLDRRLLKAPCCAPLRAQRQGLFLERCVCSPRRYLHPCLQQSLSYWSILQIRDFVDPERTLLCQGDVVMCVCCTGGIFRRTQCEVASEPLAQDITQSVPADEVSSLCKRV